MFLAFLQARYRIYYGKWDSKEGVKCWAHLCKSSEILKLSAVIQIDTVKRVGSAVHSQT